jgi:hypothetical protein
MEVTDETLDQDEHNTITLKIPDEQLFPHRGLSEEDRQVTLSERQYYAQNVEEPYKKTGPWETNDYDIPAPEDDVYGKSDQEQPTQDDYVKCDNCGISDNRNLGHPVLDRGTSMLTPPPHGEYLCPECYAQLVSQYIGIDLYPALIAVLLSDHFPVWQIASNHNRKYEAVESVSVDVLEQWVEAYEADVFLLDDERQYMKKRDERILETFPNLGHGREDIDIPTESSDKGFSAHLSKKYSGDTDTDDSIDMNDNR